MELMSNRAETTTWGWGDITFMIRTTVTAMDEFTIMNLPTEQHSDKKFYYKREEFFKKLIERFVLDWQGVTDNGRVIPYSFEVLELLPARERNEGELPPKGTIFEDLGSYIRDGIWNPYVEKVTSLKKDSGK